MSSPTCLTIAKNESKGTIIVNCETAQERPPSNGTVFCDCDTRGCALLRNRIRIAGREMPPHEFSWRLDRFMRLCDSLWALPPIQGIIFAERETSLSLTTRKSGHKFAVFQAARLTARKSDSIWVVLRTVRGRGKAFSRAGQSWTMRCGGTMGNTPQSHPPFWPEREGCGFKAFGSGEGAVRSLRSTGRSWASCASKITFPGVACYQGQPFVGQLVDHQD